MNTKNIGNIGEIKVLSKFVELGYTVYIPFGDNSKSDLVVEKMENYYVFRLKHLLRQKMG
jgi:hypothetical protein